jgi:predicted acetyltransferase
LCGGECLAVEALVAQQVAGRRPGLEQVFGDLALVHRGGHIGYGVLPECQRRGYATETLRQSLIVVRAIGVDRMLVTCGDSNIRLAIVIEKCGGQLDSVITVGTPHMVRQY